MAASAEKIDPQVLQGLVAQREQRRTPPPEVLKDLEAQRNLREGIYPKTTLAGLAQVAVGATENLGQMATGFAAAAPGAIGGAGAAAIAALDDNEYTTASGAYTAVFDAVTSALTYDPKTKRGDKYQKAIEGAYGKWIEDKWGNYIGGLVEKGYISPAEGAWMRTSADALLIGLPMKAGAALRVGKPKRGRASEERVDVDPIEGETLSRKNAKQEPVRGERLTRDPIEGEFTEIVDAPRIEGFKKLEGPVERAAYSAFDEVAPKALPRPPVERNIFLNRQAGAVDMSVIAEGVRKALRPAELGAKAGLDLSHALARQFGFKQVTDIRKLESPTAQLLADRIFPRQDSKIPLGAGFHELVSLSEGKFNTRIDMALAPLRKHVANKNSLSSFRVIALPKRVNDGIIEGLETGKAPKDLVPAVRAVREIFKDLLEYQREAGVQVAERPGYVPHLWDAKKIARAEWGGKGRFTKHLVEDLKIPEEAAADIVRTLIREDGFLDFAQDTGGRLQKGQEYNAWSRSHRVGGGEAAPAHVKPRVIDTTIAKSGEWMITDLEAILTNYVNRAVNKAEYTRIAGPGERQLNQVVRQIVEELDATGNLKSSPHTVAQGIYDMFDAMQYRFHPLDNPVVRSTVRGVSGFEVMAHLGLVSLAQLPETLIPAVKYRVAPATKSGIPVPLKSYAVGMATAVRDAISSASTVVTGKRVIPKSEIRQHLEQIGVVKVSALESSVARMMRTSGKMTSRFMRTVLMEAVTDMQRGIAYDTLNSMIRQNARYLSKGLAQGKRKKMYEAELIELGLEPEMAIDWYRKGMPKDHPFSQKMDVALVRGVDTTIIMPKAGNTPIRYNDPRFQLPLMFTRFFTTFANTVIKKVFKDMIGDTRTNARKLAGMSAVIASIGIAYYTQFLREDISGYQYRDEDDPMRVVDAVDRAGWTGQFTRLYPLLVGEYRYQLGPSYVANLLGGPVGTDAAKAIDAAKRAYSKGDMEPVAKWMASMTPIANITPETEEELQDFYLELLEAVE